MTSFIKTDVLILGSGGAGCLASIEVAKAGLQATIVTKGKFGRSGATITGDADFDVDSKSLHNILKMPGADPRDNPEIFFEDMVIGGKYLNEQNLVEVHVKEAPERLKDFIEWGLRIHYITRTSGHRYPRGAVAPGPAWQATLNKVVKEHGVEIIEDTMITDLLISNGKIAGAIGLNIREGEVVVFRAKAVVLATGGLMRLYPITTAPHELTGDGYAMAYRAGAELIDMEFPQFLPGVFVWPPALQGVDFPFLVSTEGELRGWLLNKFGERFMEKWDPVNKECTTRDIASVAMMTEILEGRGSPHGGVYVSLSHLPRNLVEYAAEWAAWYRGFRYGGFDLKKILPDIHEYALEAAPAVHFHHGGVVINEKCETNIPGLFAAGEVVGGVHGANRLSGNAFTEFAVFGVRAGRFAAEYAKKTPSLLEINKEQIEKLEKEILAPLKREKGVSPVMIRKKVQELAWKYLGPVRTGEGLKTVLSEVENLKRQLNGVATTVKDEVYNKEWIEALEMKNGVLVLEMMAKAALMRTESRGAHYRRDYPNTDNNNWLKHIVIRQEGGMMTLKTRPVTMTKLVPPKGIKPYGQKW